MVMQWEPRTIKNSPLICFPQVQRGKKAGSRVCLIKPQKRDSQSVLSALDANIFIWALVPGHSWRVGRWFSMAACLCKAASTLT